MSSYLTFYLKPRVEEQKPITLISYSRNTEVYKYFDNSIHPVYIGLEETQYTELTKDKVNRVIEDLKCDISKSQKRLLEYEKYSAGNSEMVEYIIELKEYIEDLEWALQKIEFIKDLVERSSYSHTDYCKILCNVD